MLDFLSPQTQTWLLATSTILFSTELTTGYLDSFFDRCTGDTHAKGLKYLRSPIAEVHPSKSRGYAWDFRFLNRCPDQDISSVSHTSIHRRRVPEAAGSAGCKYSLPRSAFDLFN